MELPYSFGRVESKEGFGEIVVFSALQPGAYGRERHLAWTYDVMLPRLFDGKAIASAVQYEERLIAATVAYPQPASEGKLMPGIELKFHRSIVPGRDIGRLSVITCVVACCETMELPARTPVRVHLDTNNDEAAAFFEAIGFRFTGDADLYDSGVIDRMYEKIYRSPHKLQLSS